MPTLYTSIINFLAHYLLHCDALTKNGKEIRIWSIPLVNKIIKIQVSGAKERATRKVLRDIGYNGKVEIRCHAPK